MEKVALLHCRAQTEILKPEDIKDVFKLIPSAKALLLQFEIPQAVVERSIEIAHHTKVPIILNAAPPIYSLSRSAWSKVNILICNEK